MKIELGNDFFIDVDELNYTLRKRVMVEEEVKKNGDVIAAHMVERTLGFYSNFENAIKGLLQYHQSNVGKELSLSLNEYVDFINKSNLDAILAFKEVMNK